MPSRGQSITVTYTAWDTSANAGKTGDVANHTLRWVKDGTSAAPTNAAAEVDAANAPGLYKLVLTGTECTCDFGVLAGKSSTANVSIMPISISFEQLPTAAAGANGGLPTVDANNAVKVQSGTGANQISLSSGLVTLAGVTHTGAVIPTVTTLTGHTAQTGDAFARLGAPAGASVSADIAAVKAQTAAIEADTQDIQARIPAALVSGRMDASVGAVAAGAITAAAIATGAIDADAIAADAVTEIQSGLATAAALATVDDFLDTEIAAIKAVTDKLDTALELDTAVYRFTANALELAPVGAGGTGDWTSGEKEQIRHRLGIDGTATAPSTGTPSLATQASVNTVDDFLDTEIAAIKAKTDLIPAAPAAVGDIPTAAAIADAVWDEATTGHTTAGTFGEQAKTDIDAIKAKTDNLPAAPAATGDIPTAATIADAVWDEARAGHVAAGSFGEGVASVQGNVTGNLAGSAGSVTAGVTVTTNNDKTGYRLSATGVDDFWDEAVDGSTTARQSARLQNSAAAGKVSGAATTTVTIRDLADTKARITATVDADGNRTAITTDVT